MKKKLTKRVVAQPTIKPTAPAQPSASTACDHCGADFGDTKKLQKHLDNAPCGTYLPQGSRGRKFTSIQVDVPEATPAQQKAREQAVVVIGEMSKTAIELRRADGVVVFIPHALSGLAVERLPVKSFDAAWKPQGDYPTGRAAKLYVGYATDLGGTSEALAELSNLVPVTEKEKEMAEKKLSSNKAVATVTKTVDAGKHGKVKVQGTAKPKNSAASMFKGLIMEGKYTDDEIFAKVKAAFNLDDGKRGYVSWYRNALKKDGQNPPPPKGGETTNATKASGKKTKAA